MKERLFRAYWTEGRRLGRVDELVELAAEVGLEPVAACQALESGTYLERVRGDMEQVHRYGVRGVPFLVLDGKYGLSGAQEPDTFLKAVEAVAEEQRGTV